jgi:hypothetical protein
MSTRGGKAVFGIGLVVFGIAVFMLASAYLVERGQPKWLAGAVGALAFPVLPVVWQAIGERRRRARLAAAKTQPKGSLAPGDRYIMRAVAVAVLVLGPMFAVGGLGVLRAGWNHKPWFVPDPHVDTIEGLDDMMAHLPADADAVLLVRDHDAKQANKAGVIAYGDHQLAMITPAEASDQDKAHAADALKSLDEQRKKLPFVKIDPIDYVALGDDFVGIATDKWKSAIRVAGAGPRQAIKTELAKAPKDAVVSLAYVPARPVDGIEKLTGWVLQAGTNEKLTVEAELVAVDAAAADKLIDLARVGWKQQRAELPEKCHATIDKIAEGADLERKGSIVKFHVTVQPEHLVEVMFCGIKSATSDDD